MKNVTREVHLTLDSHWTTMCTLRCIAYLQRFTASRFIPFLSANQRPPKINSEETLLDIANSLHPVSLYPFGVPSVSFQVCFFQGVSSSQIPTHYTNSQYGGPYPLHPQPPVLGEHTVPDSNSWLALASGKWSGNLAKCKMAHGFDSCRLLFLFWFDWIGFGWVGWFVWLVCLVGLFGRFVWSVCLVGLFGWLGYPTPKALSSNTSCLPFLHVALTRRSLHGA